MARTVYDLNDDTDQQTAGMHLVVVRDSPAWAVLEQIGEHLATEALRERPKTLEELAELRGRAEGVKRFLNLARQLADNARDNSRVEAAVDAIEGAVIQLPGMNGMD